MAHRFSDLDVLSVAELLDVYFDLHKHGGRFFYLDVISSEYDLSRVAVLSLAEAYGPSGDIAALTAALRSL